MPLFYTWKLHSCVTSICSHSSCMADTISGKAREENSRSWLESPTYTRVNLSRITLFLDLLLSDQGQWQIFQDLEVLFLPSISKTQNTNGMCRKLSTCVMGGTLCTRPPVAGSITAVLLAHHVTWRKSMWFPCQYPKNNNSSSFSFFGLFWRFR